MRCKVPSEVNARCSMLMESHGDDRDAITKSGDRSTRYVTLRWRSSSDASTCDPFSKRCENLQGKPEHQSLVLTPNKGVWRRVTTLTRATCWAQVSVELLSRPACHLIWGIVILSEREADQLNLAVEKDKMLQTKSRKRGRSLLRQTRSK